VWRSLSMDITASDFFNCLSTCMIILERLHLITSFGTNTSFNILQSASLCDKRYSPFSVHSTPKKS
jgi:hypothetical protein